MRMPVRIVGVVPINQQPAPDHREQYRKIDPVHPADCERMLSLHSNAGRSITGGDQGAFITLMHARINLRRRRSEVAGIHTGRAGVCRIPQGKKGYKVLLRLLLGTRNFSAKPFILMRFDQSRFEVAPECGTAICNLWTYPLHHAGISYAVFLPASALILQV